MTDPHKTMNLAGIVMLLVLLALVGGVTVSVYSKHTTAIAFEAKP